MDRIFFQFFFRITKSKHAHGLLSQCIDLTVKNRLVDNLNVSILVQILLRPGKQTFRSAFIIGFTCMGNHGLAELVHGVKSLRGCDLIVFIALQRMKRIFSEEFHQSLIGRIAADHPVLCVKHGLCVLSDRQIQRVLHSRMPGKLRKRDHLTVCGEKFHHLQTSFGNRAGLVTEQNIQRTCRFDSFRFSHQHVVIQHLAGILHQYQRDHKRQSFRNRADNDHDCKRYCFHNIFDYLFCANGKIG